MASVGPVVQNGLFGAGNAGVSNEQIREFINTPGVTGRQILDKALETNVSVKQIADAMQGQEGFSAKEINSFLRSEGVDVPQQFEFQARCEQQAAEQAARDAALLAARQADAQAAVAQEQRDKASRRAAAAQNGALFGPGNESITSDQIRQFVKTPGATPQQILDAALDQGVSAAQIVLAMKDEPGWSMGEVRGFLAQKGLNASDAYWSDVQKLTKIMSAQDSMRDAQSKLVLLGEGNLSISSEDIRGFVKQVVKGGGDPAELRQRALEAAVGHKINVPQLLSAMLGEQGWSSESVRDYLKTQGLEFSDADWSAVENQVQNPFTDKSSIKNAKGVLFGMGNGAISADDIQSFANQPDLLRRDLLDAALENGVSVAQVAVAMRGKPGWSPAEIRGYLESQGVKASGNYWTEVSDLLTVMYGNKRDQHKAVSALFGEGNTDISGADIRAFVKNTRNSAEWSQDTLRQLVDVAVVNKVSVEQIATAMQGEANWNPAALQKFLFSQGLEAPKGDAYWTQLEQQLPSHVFTSKKQLKEARATAFGEGNSQLSDAEIRHFYDTPRYLDRESLDAALENGVSVEQYVTAMQSTPEWQKRNLIDNIDNVRNYLTSVGLNAPDNYWVQLESKFDIV